ncbi:hypothetical protein chiPu_0025019, partial [Chiloscyllium punctatum]|nr:hypothetical protein [Chiloscyllium punctatum]
MDGPREPVHHRPGPVAGTVSATAAAPPVELPPSWAQAPDPSLVPLSVSDAEYQMVYWTFHQTLAESRFIVVRICRVQNAALWQKYV